MQDASCLVRHASCHTVRGCKLWRGAGGAEARARVACPCAPGASAQEHHAGSPSLPTASAPKLEYTGTLSPPACQPQPTKRHPHAAALRRRRIALVRLNASARARTGPVVGAACCRSAGAGARRRSVRSRRRTCRCTRPRRGRERTQPSPGRALCRSARAARLGASRRAGGRERVG